MSLLTAPSTALLTPLLVNSRSLALLTECIRDESESETYLPVLLAGKDMFKNINLSLLLLCQSFATNPSRLSSYKACTVALDYDIIKIKDFINL
jgi:hypothetical protein